VQSKRIAKVLGYTRPSSKLIWAQCVELVSIVRGAALLSRRGMVFHSWLIRTWQLWSKRHKDCGLWVNSVPNISGRPEESPPHPTHSIGRWLAACLPLVRALSWSQVCQWENKQPTWRIWLVWRKFGDVKLPAFCFGGGTDLCSDTWD
jgi:hypothetical protein